MLALFLYKEIIEVCNRETLRMDSAKSRRPANKVILSLVLTKTKKFCDGMVFFGGGMAALFLCWSLWRVCTVGVISMPLIARSNVSSQLWVLKDPSSIVIQQQNPNGGLESERGIEKKQELQSRDEEGDQLFEKEWESSAGNFYADSDFSYSVGKTIKNWDRKRELWLKMHPHVKNYTEGGNPRLLVLTGSQFQPCKNHKGDHLLLRFFKNKQDYCRLHGLDLFYNNILIHPQMITFWAKIPVVRAAMVAHPEAEWIWWIDSDAIITDMEFEHPMEKYKDYNMIVHGWEKDVYVKRSWLGVNAGVFLIRNCEWSMNFMERWSAMGPLSPLYVPFAKILSDVLPDRAVTDSDDQSALIYLMIKEKDKWADKIYIENSYFFQGYWLDVVGIYENVSKWYDEMENENPVLKRRYAEKSGPMYRKMKEYYLHKRGAGISQRKPFVTHFTGCQPCSGHHNKIYKEEDCLQGMEKALNFADDQVLRIYGFQRHDLLSSQVSPIAFSN